MASKEKEYLVSVTYTRTVNKQIKAPDANTAKFKLRHLLMEAPLRIKAEEMSEVMAEEIFTIAD